MFGGKANRTCRSMGCLLLAQSGHSDALNQCPLSGVKRTLRLANAGRDTRSIQAYLGHKDIRHTVRYTELSPTRFKNFFPG